MNLLKLKLSFVILAVLALAAPAQSGTVPPVLKYYGGQSLVIPAGAFANCVARCNAQARACHNRLTALGDQQGWDGDLRQDYWDQNCQPVLDGCTNSCPPLQPGECYTTYDGGTVCS